MDPRLFEEKKAMFKTCDRGWTDPIDHTTGMNVKGKDDASRPIRFREISRRRKDSLMPPMNPIKHP